MDELVQSNSLVESRSSIKHLEDSLRILRLCDDDEGIQSSVFWPFGCWIQSIPPPISTICRHPMQRYAATSDVTLHFYPATHFARTRQPAAGGRSNLPKTRHLRQFGCQ